MKKQFLECGKIVTTHGIKGEVKVQPWCDSPDFLLDFETLFLRRGETPLTVERARVQKNMVVLKIAGVDTPEAAAALRNQVLYIDRADAPVGEGEYFVQDLIDCEVFDADTGRSYGKVYDVRPTGAERRLLPAGRGGEGAAGARHPRRGARAGRRRRRIVIRPLEGLFDD